MDTNKENKHELEELLNSSKCDDCLDVLRTFTIYSRGNLIPDDEKRSLYTGLFHLTDVFAKKMMAAIGYLKHAEYDEVLKDLMEIMWRLSETAEDPVFDKENRENIKAWNRFTAFKDILACIDGKTGNITTNNMIEERSLMKAENYLRFFEKVRPKYGLGILRSFYKDMSEGRSFGDNSRLAHCELFISGYEYLAHLKFCCEEGQDKSKELVEYVGLLSKLFEKDDFSKHGTEMRGRGNLLIFAAAKVLTDHYPDMQNSKVADILKTIGDGKPTDDCNRVCSGN